MVEWGFKHSLEPTHQALWIILPPVPPQLARLFLQISLRITQIVFLWIRWDGITIPQLFRWMLVRQRIGLIMTMAMVNQREQREVLAKQPQRQEPMLWDGHQPQVRQIITLLLR